MKILFATVMLWTGILFGSLQAQTISYYLGDTLKILNQGELYTSLISDDLYKLNITRDHKTLIQSFIRDFESIKDNIPDYELYKINYVKDKNLIVEEVTGIKKYQIENNQAISAYNQNIAQLKSEKLTIIFYFTTLEDLASRDHELIVQNAIDEVTAKVKRKKFSMRPTQKVFNYSYSKGTLLDNKDLIPKRTYFSVVPSVKVGIFKNKPIYEIGIGGGLRVGQKKQDLFYVFWSANSRYDEETKENLHSDMVGLAYKFRNIATIKMGVPLKHNSPVFEDSDVRISLTVYPYKASSVSLDMYTHSGDSNRMLLGVRIGYGL